MSGLSIFAFGEGLLVKAHFGATPWTVFALGLTNQTGISLGGTTLMTSAIVLLGWIPLRVKLGMGSIMNALWFPVVLDLTVHLWPTPHALWLRVVTLACGLAVFAIGASLYLSCGMSPGPRDGLMTGVHDRFGWPIARVRLGLEFIAMSVGWAMGGTVGVGTLLFVLLIGYLIATSFTVLRHVAGAPGA